MKLINLSPTGKIVYVDSCPSNITIPKLIAYYVTYNEFDGVDKLFSGRRRHYYESGELLCDLEIDDGKLHGVQRYYYKTRKLNSEYHYLYGYKVTEIKYQKHQLAEEQLAI